MRFLFGLRGIIGAKHALRLQAGELNGAVEILKVITHGIVKDYQYLDHDYREEVQLPLNDSSWPHYGSIFTYVHVQLVILKSNLDYVIQLGRAVWERHGQDARLIDVFNLKTGVRMLDLISALQEFVEAKPKPVKLRR